MVQFTELSSLRSAFENAQNVAAPHGVLRRTLLQVSFNKMLCRHVLLRDCQSRLIVILIIHSLLRGDTIAISAVHAHAAYV